MPEHSKKIVSGLVFTAKNSSDVEIAVEATRSLANYLDVDEAVSALTFIMQNHKLKEARVEAAKSLGKV